MMSRPVNVMLYEGYPFYFYGAQQRLFNVVELLDRTLVQPLVVCPAEGIFVERIRELDVDVLVIPLHPKLLRVGGSLRHSSLEQRMAEAIRLMPHVLALTKLIRSREIELMDCNTMRGALTAGWAAKIARIPLIWHASQFVPLGYMEMLAHLISDAVIADADPITNSYSEDVVARVFRKPVIQIYEGIPISDFEPRTLDTSIRQEFGFAEDDHIVGIVASLVPRKGIDIFIEMAKVVSSRFEKERFLVVGNTPKGFPPEHEQYLRALAMDLTEAGRLVFAGWRDDLVEMYAAMNVFVLPSLMEGFPLVTLQAMLMGKPVIATDIAGIPAQVLDGITGYLVPPGDTAALISAVEKLLGDPDSAKVMGAAGRQRVIDLFPIERLVRQMEQVYLRFLGRQWPGAEPSDNTVVAKAQTEVSDAESKAT